MYKIVEDGKIREVNQEEIIQINKKGKTVSVFHIEGGRVVNDIVLPETLSRLTAFLQRSIMKDGWITRISCLWKLFRCCSFHRWSHFGNSPHYYCNKCQKERFL